MEVITGLSGISPFHERTAVAIGNFDGLHLGHQQILHSLVHSAQKNGLPSLVFTFSPHPEKILGKKPILMIQTLEQRLNGFRAFPVQYVVLASFDEKLANLSSRGFVENIVVKTLNAQEVVVGENFRFGKGRKGNIHVLMKLSHEFGIRLHSHSPVIKDGQIISSSLIRDHLLGGHVEKANDLLGRAYEIEGKVVKGESRGMGLGFPTANIETQNEIMPSGVFLTTARVGLKTLPSLTNVGSRPTFHKPGMNVETFILDFSRNLYGEKISVRFYKKIRDETRFQDATALSRQIAQDLKAAREYFANLP